MFLFSQETKLKVDVDKRVADIGDQVQLIIVVENATKRPQIRLPVLSDFELMNPDPFTSQQTSIINGSMSQSLTMTYVLQPKREGELIIPAFKIELSGKTYETQPIKVKILRNTEKEKEVANFAFLTNTVSSSSPVINEEVTVTTKLFLRQDVQVYNNSISFGNEPHIQGVWQ